MMGKPCDVHDHKIDNETDTDFNTITFRNAVWIIEKTHRNLVRYETNIVNFSGISNGCSSFSPQRRKERKGSQRNFYFVVNMILQEFKKSLSLSDPPKGISTLLVAMWYDAKGDWAASHNIAQDIHSKEGSWIHAYLHRKEGDEGNAGYWYARAGRKMPSISLEEEWDAICDELLRSDKRA